MEYSAQFWRLRSLTGGFEKEQLGDIAGLKAMIGPGLDQYATAFMTAAGTIDHDRVLRGDNGLCRVVIVQLVRPHEAGPDRPA